jgi:hypothetical protein
MIDAFVRKNFLTLWCVFAFIFALAMGKTVFQKENSAKNNPEAPLITWRNAFWTPGKSEQQRFVVWENSQITTQTVTLRWQALNLKTDTHSPSVEATAQTVPALQTTLQKGSLTSHIFQVLNTELFPYSHRLDAPDGTSLRFQQQQYRREQAGKGSGQVLGKRHFVEAVLGWVRMGHWPTDDLTMSHLGQMDMDWETQASLRDSVGTAWQVYELQGPTENFQVVFEKKTPYRVISWHQIRHQAGTRSDFRLAPTLSPAP